MVNLTASPMVVVYMPGIRQEKLYSFGKTSQRTLTSWREVSITATDSGFSCSTTAQCGLYLPESRLGRGNFFYVYSGYAAGCCTGPSGIGPNFFGLSITTGIDATGWPTNKPGLTVQEAASIDRKVDDGVPTSGSVIAQYVNTGVWGYRILC